MKKRLFISGFGFKPNLLAEIYDAEPFDYQVYENIGEIPVLGEYDEVIAWSLGGIVASHLIEQNKLKANQLILISVPKKFVDFKVGMNIKKYKLLAKQILDNPLRAMNFIHGDITKIKYETNMLNLDYWFEFLQNDFANSVMAKFHFIAVHDRIIPKENSIKIKAEKILFEDSDHFMIFNKCNEIRRYLCST